MTAKSSKFLLFECIYSEVTTCHQFVMSVLWLELSFVTNFCC